VVAWGANPVRLVGDWSSSRNWKGETLCMLQHYTSARSKYSQKCAPLFWPSKRVLSSEPSTRWIR